MTTTRTAPPDLLTSELGVICIEEGAVGKLRNDFIEWASPFACPTFAQEERDDGLVCVTTNEFADQLDEITKDRYLNFAEAPFFFDIGLELSGEDRYLTEEEISPGAFRRSLKKLEENKKTYEKGKEDDTIANRFSHYWIAKKVDEKTLFGAKSVVEHAVVLNPDSYHTMEIRDHLLYGEKLLQTMIDFLEERKDFLFEESLSFWNFTSAENLFGLSAYFTRDGNPFSHGELEGVRRAIRASNEILEGLTLFQKQAETNMFNPSDPRIQKFLKSPMAYLCHLTNHLGGAEGSADEWNQSTLHDALGKMVGLVYQCNATRTARELVEYLKERGSTDTGYSTPPDFKEWNLEAYLGDNTLFRYLDYQFTQFGNAFASLDSLALAATGTFAGKAIAATAKGAVWASEILGSNWSRLLPGVRLIPHAQSGWRGIALTATNLGLEFAKFEGYRFAGFALGDMTGTEISTKGFLFAAGMFGALEQGVAAMMFDDALRPPTPNPARLALQAREAELEGRIRQAMEELRGATQDPALLQRGEGIAQQSNKTRAVRQLRSLKEEAERKKARSGSWKRPKRATPPSLPRLTADFISEMTKGKATIVAEALRRMADFCNGDPARREAVLKAIRAIAGEASQRIRVSLEGGKVLRLKEKGFDIFFKRLGDGKIEITDFS